MTNHISGIRSCKIFCLRCQRQDVKCCSRRGDSGLGAGCRGTELFFTHPMPSGSAGGRFHRHASRLWPWSLLGADGLEDVIDHFYYGNLPATQQSYDSFLQFVESAKECCRQRPLELPPLHLDGIVLWSSVRGGRNRRTTSPFVLSMYVSMALLVWAPALSMIA